MIFSRLVRMFDNLLFFVCWFLDVVRFIKEVQKTLRKTFAQLIKKLYVEELESPSSLELFGACRLIPLDKKPGLRPIVVGEVLRRIAGKAVMMLFKNDITHAAGALQLSPGQDARAEVVVHFMH